MKSKVWDSRRSQRLTTSRSIIGRQSPYLLQASTSAILLYPSIEPRLKILILLVVIAGNVSCTHTLSFGLGANLPRPTLPPGSIVVHVGVVVSQLALQYCTSNRVKPAPLNVVFSVGSTGLETKSCWVKTFIFVMVLLPLKATSSQVGKPFVAEAQFPPLPNPIRSPLMTLLGSEPGNVDKAVATPPFAASA